MSRHCVEVGLDGDDRCGHECGQVRTIKRSLIGKEAGGRSGRASGRNGN